MHEHQRQRTPVARRVPFLVCLLVGAGLLAGCGALPQIGSKGVDEARPTAEVGAAPEATSNEQVFYVAEDGLNVYSEPYAKSRLVVELPLHQRVLRSELQHGYARIRTEDDRIHGWVDNAKLIWRVPSKVAPIGPAAADAPAAAAAESPAAEPEAAVASPVPTTPAVDSAAPAPTEAPAEAPPKTEPSVFDSF